MLSDGDLKLEKILDLPQIRSLMELFHRLVQIPMAIIDVDGKILVGVGWQELCTAFHRVHPDTRRNCLESDVQLSAGVPPGEFRRYRCRNHLWDIATPLVIDGRHFGNLFIGQFFFDDETVDRDLFRTQAEAFGFDENAYLAALDRVPRLSREKVEGTMAFFLALAETLSQLGYKNIRLARTEENLSRATRTAERRAADAEKSRAILEAIMDHVPDGLGVCDTHGAMILASRCGIAMSGMSREEFEGSTPEERCRQMGLLLPETRTPAAVDDLPMVQALRTGEPVVNRELLIRRDDGEEITIRSNAGPIRDAQGRITGAVQMWRDITELKQAQRRLDTQNRRLKLLSQLAEKLFSADAPEDAARTAFELLAPELDLHIYVNFLQEDDQSLRLDSSFGIPEETASEITRLEYGQAVCGLVAQSRRAIHAMGVQESTLERFDLIRRFGLGAYFCSPLVIGERFLGTLSFGTRSRDAFSEEELELLTEAVRYVALADERILSQRELRQTKEAAEEATRAKSEFLANMSHEIRTPMTIFMAAIEHLLQIEEDPERRHLLEMADESAERLRTLIDGILDFSRIEARKVDLEEAPVDIRACVRDAVHMFSLSAGAKDLRLEAEVAPDIPERVLADRDRLGQILINLVGNAVKFTEAGEIRVRVRSDDDRLQFSVCDTGIGIPVEKCRLLFQSFSQVDSSFNRKIGGTGLGLAISKGLVELMGGEISCRSREGEGSVFTFTLPLKASGKEECTTEEGPDQAAERVVDARILLAEDEPVIREMLASMLAHRGWETHSAASGRDAVEQWERGDFDLILMDLQMPGMNGIEATQAIRQREAQRGRRTRIIGLTANALQETRERCLAAGMDEVLLKPVQMKELFSVVQRSL